MKYLRVMYNKTSHQSGLEFKIGEVNIATNWNKLDKFNQPQGFNISNEENILRWIIRGDTLYDVEIPDDATIIKIENDTTPNGIYRTNKIIVNNPRLITDDLALELYKKSNMPEKTYYKTLAILAIKGFKNTCIELIKDRVNRNNIDLVLSEYNSFFDNNKQSVENTLFYEIQEMLNEIKSNLLISIVSEKEPYIKNLTDDKVINIAGQSGSGKSTYTLNYVNDENFVVIDTDVIISNHETNDKKQIEFKKYLKNKYQRELDLSYDFDLVYNEILNYFKDENKTIVIDCAQFHCIKDLSILKGKIIILRTSISTCYKRCIERYERLHPNYTIEELNKYKNKKLKIYDWYHGTNEFIKKVDKWNIFLKANIEDENIKVYKNEQLGRSIK